MRETGLPLGMIAVVDASAPGGINDIRGVEKIGGRRRWRRGPSAPGFFDGAGEVQVKVA